MHKIDQVTEVGALLSQLQARLVEGGAWFSQDLRVEVADTGDISLRALPQASTKLKNYLRVPVTLMPQLDDYHLTLKEDLSIDCRPLIEGSERPVDEIMQLIVAIYNATYKIPTWQQNYPLSTLANADALLTHLLEFMPNSKLQMYQTLRSEQGEQAYLLKSFLGSRLFNLKPKHRQAIGQEGADQAASILLPMIDFLNHSMAAQPFKIEEQPTLSMRTYAIPDEQTGELFIRYNLYDAVQTYLVYGFVDTQVPWLYSAPSTFKVGETIFEVANSFAQNTRPLPPHLKDLRQFIPVTMPHENVVKLSKLVIPGSAAPRSLKRVLTLLIKQFALPDASHDQLYQAALTVEKQLIDQNITYWQQTQRLKQQADEQHLISQEASAMLQQLIDQSQQKLVHYQTMAERI